MVCERISLDKIRLISIWALFVILLCASASADNLLSITLSTPEPVDAVAALSHRMVGTDTVISTYEPLKAGKGQIRLSLPAGAWEFSAIVDMNTTPAPDYYGEMKSDLRSNEERVLNMEPIGFIQGEVVDTDKNLIPDAQIELNCINPSQIHSFPFATDSFGTIKATAVHTGPCRIMAKHGDLVGFAQTIVQQGEIQSVNVVLNQSTRPTTSIVNPIIIVVLIVVVIFAVVAYLILGNFWSGEKKPSERKNKASIKKQSNTMRQSNTKNPSITKKHSKPQKVASDSKVIAVAEASSLSSGSQAILKTLTPSEHKVVECLLELGNKATQAKIYHTTRIPKSNLFRIVQSLERKNIISSERFGKVKNLQLTGFFLGK